MRSRRLAIAVALLPIVVGAASAQSKQPQGAPSGARRAAPAVRMPATPAKKPAAKTAVPTPPAPVPVTLVPSHKELRLAARGEVASLSVRVLNQGTRRPVPGATVRWRSASPLVATVSPSGQVAAVNNGTTQVWAISGRDSVAVPVTVTRKPARLGFVPQSVYLDAVGTYQPIKVEVRDARDNSLADGKGTPVCRIRDDYVATLAPNGRVSARNNGLTWVLCQRDVLRDSLRVEVRQRAARAQIVADGPSYVLKNVGDSLRLAMIAVDRMGETILDGWVTWISEEPAIAHVDVSTGVVIGVSVGSTTIVGRIDGIEDSITVTVREPLPRGAIAMRARERIASRLPLPQGDFDGAAPSAMGAPAVTPVASTSRPAGPAQPLDKVTRLDVVAPNRPHKPGDTVQVTAIARNYRNDLLTGKTVSWSTPDSAKARALPDGRMLLTDTGRVTVVGTIAEVSGQVVLNVRPAASDGGAQSDGLSVTPARRAGAAPVGGARRSTGLSALNPRNQAIVDSIIRVDVIGTSTMRGHAPRRAISLTPIAGYGERLVDDRDTTDLTPPLRVRGLVYGAQVDIVASRMFGLQGSFLAGTLTPVGPTGLKQTMAEVGGTATLALQPWIALLAGATYRGFARDVATDQWLTMRTGGELRMDFVGGALRAVVGATYFPMVKVDGVSNKPNLGLGATAGLEYRARLFTAGLRYDAERYDFPDPTPRTRHLEQVSSLKLRMGVMLGKY